MNRTVYILIVTLLIFMSNAASGQDKSMNAFTGTLIEAGTDKPVEDGYVGIMQGDSLVWFGATDKKRAFQCRRTCKRRIHGKYQRVVL